METPPNCDRGRWSELPMDLLRCLLERLSFVDFHRAKMVCSIWYLCSKQALGPKAGSPMLMVSQEEGSYRLYNPEEDRVYKAKSNYRFLGSSGKWFLVVDSRSDLHIINVFSNERIRLPPLETIKSSRYKIERLGGNKGFNEFIIIEHETFSSGNLVNAEDLRAVLWVDEKKGDYVVVWRFDACPYLLFCKKGDVHYREISTRFGVPSGGLESVVLKGYGLYVQTEQGYIRHLDLSGQHSFEDVWAINWHPVNTDVYERMGGYRIISFSDNFAVTTSGKKQDTKLIKVDSLGDEALFLDFGITVPGDIPLSWCSMRDFLELVFPCFVSLCFQSDSFGERGCALQLEGCLVKYDNVMFFGVADTTAMVMSCGKPAGYKYKSDDATDCQDCLMEAIQRLKLQPFCGTSTWGDVYLAKCYVGYSSSGSIGEGN
ncbi:hypothetical protein F2Q68_00012359 [Brassica cretica]|uniref:F-box domain-containing protein n=1 Tax=Brassica cretica TaxID=69181 RepID=A0A8S9KYC7_BRACR|nr:hypothetical protein F2Q68_00012359 [Brassica cretica]